MARIPVARLIPRPTIPGWDTNRLIALLELPGFARSATTREVLSMPGKTAKVTITERQHDILRTIQNAPTASSQLRQRAAIILLAFDRQGNPQIAAQVGLSRRQVSLWRRRWADAGTGSFASSASKATPPWPGHRASPPR